jgi:hypothetical protein
MKKQEFHRRKIRFSERPKLDYEQIKARTIIALDKLGHQKFSAEPGGYSLENWMKGMNLLLDEFEEKMGAAKLPSEYAEKRRELTDCMSKPVDLSSIDNSMAELRQNEEEVVRRFDEARAQAAAKVDELRDEQARFSAELVEEKERLSAAAAEQRSGSFFRRLFGRRSTPPADASEGKVEELESRLRALPDEILEQQRTVKSIDQRSSESPWAEDWKKLESLQVRLKELENERLEKVQLVREREATTASIASAISRISPGEDRTEGEALSSS